MPTKRHEIVLSRFVKTVEKIDERRCNTVFRQTSSIEENVFLAVIDLLLFAAILPEKNVPANSLNSFWVIKGVRLFLVDKATGEIYYKLGESGTGSGSYIETVGKLEETYENLFENMLLCG